ncbi:hypothetical protein BKI52_43630 [marine bacterium AO1-C]|nr:hypothetical protein BKI52_43630 [marine bacterium AO1-C]
MDELISHIKSLISISDHQLEVVLDKLVEKRFSKKEHLLYVDHYAHEVFFTLRGCIRTYVSDFNGVEHNLSFALENWWFGDLQSFLNKTLAIHNIQALEDTLVLAINQEKWHTLTQEVPEFVNYLNILFRNAMFSLQNRVVQSLSLTAEERYSIFLKEYPNLSQRISQKHIASYLGITPEFLSMIRSKKKR